uniref:Uncharacterized protein n=1 Tax=Prolemur simus TaxID=1328070 RepID=A0A8C9AA07_PROSS
MEFLAFYKNLISKRRHYVLCTLPRITTLDFSGVTKVDCTTAEVWKHMNIKPLRFPAPQQS